MSAETATEPKVIKDEELETIVGGTHCYELIAKRSKGNAKPPEGMLNTVNC